MVNGSAVWAGQEVQECSWCELLTFRAGGAAAAPAGWQLGAADVRLQAGHCGTCTVLVLLWELLRICSFGTLVLTLAGCEGVAEACRSALL